MSFKCPILWMISSTLYKVSGINCIAQDAHIVHIHVYAQCALHVTADLIWLSDEHLCQDTLKPGFWAETEGIIVTFTWQG